MSDTSHPDWREAYELARQEKDPARLLEMCALARRLIQNRLLALSTLRHLHDDEVAELEAALRELWVIEEKNH